MMMTMTAIRIPSLAPYASFPDSTTMVFHGHHGRVGKRVVIKRYTLWHLRHRTPVLLNVQEYSDIALSVDPHQLSKP